MIDCVEYYNYIFFRTLCLVYRKEREGNLRRRLEMIHASMAQFPLSTCDLLRGDGWNDCATESEPLD